MKIKNTGIGWALAIILGGWALLYFFTHMHKDNYMEGAMGNLFATILGLVVGLPLALRINQEQQNISEATQKLLIEERDSIRRKKVLSLLQRELKNNYEETKARRLPMVEGKERLVFATPYETQLWEVFSAGGDLNCINDPSLLAVIAQAYYRVRNAIALEKEYFAASHFQGMRTTEQEKAILNYLVQLDNLMLRDIKRATDLIEAELVRMRIRGE